MTIVEINFLMVTWFKIRGIGEFWNNRIETMLGIRNYYREESEIVLEDDYLINGIFVSTYDIS